MAARELYNAAVAQLVAAQQQQLSGFKKAGKASADAIKDAESLHARGAPPA